MSRRKPVLLMLCALSLNASAEMQQNAEGGEALPLPRWSKEELQAFRDNMPDVNATGVLPPEPISQADINELLLGPVTSGPRLDGHFNSQDSLLSPRLQPEGMRFFLPESVLSTPQNHPIAQKNEPTPLSSLHEVTPEFLSSARQALPGEYFIDPDQLLSEMHREEMTRFLEFHARDARIKLYVLAISHDRRITDGTSLDAIASGTLLKNDSCLLVFPLGEPWRTRLFLSKGIHDQTSAEFLGETIHACLRESLHSSDEHDQLKRYAVHLSTRLFWLQKALGGGVGSLQDESKPSVLAEVLTEESTRTNPTSAGTANHVIWAASALLSLSLAGAFVRWLLHKHQTRHRNRVWILAEKETLPRLGGAFTGGGGGMIQY